MNFPKLLRVGAIVRPTRVFMISVLSGGWEPWLVLEEGKKKEVGDL